MEFILWIILLAWWSPPLWVFYSAYFKPASEILRTLADIYLISTLSLLLAGPWFFGVFGGFAPFAAIMIFLSAHFTSTELLTVVPPILAASAMYAFLRLLPNRLKTLSPPRPIVGILSIVASISALFIVAHHWNRAHGPSQEAILSTGKAHGLRANHSAEPLAEYMFFPSRRSEREVRSLRSAVGRRGGGW